MFAFDIDIDFNTGLKGIENESFLSEWFDKDYSVIESFERIDSICDSSMITFTNHIDDLYNTQIEDSKEDFLYNIKKITTAHDINDIKYHSNEALDDIRSQVYWEKCRFDSEMELRKADLFLNYINEQWDIMNQTQKDDEAIYNGVYGKDKLSFEGQMLTIEDLNFTNNEEITLDENKYIDSEVHSNIYGVNEYDKSSQIVFGSKYTDVEISKMKSDVDNAQSEVNACKREVNNWESKVSLNDTKEHRANGDYSHAIDKLNDAKSRYNHAVDELNNAKRKLNSAT